MELRPDFVKLDRSWIGGFDRDPVRQALIAGIAHFAATAVATAIGEGIETAAELEALPALGVRLGQGYLLGMPAPAGGPAQAA